MLFRSIPFYNIAQGTDFHVLWLSIYFLACLPSTVSSSVVMVSIAKGNVPSAIFNASISGLIAPISLATTFGISVDFFSCGYLDVSVRHVRLADLWIQSAIPLRVGFPIRTSADQSLFASSPRLFAGYNVLHRL